MEQISLKCFTSQSINGLVKIIFLRIIDRNLVFRYGISSCGLQEEVDAKLFTGWRSNFCSYNSKKWANRGLPAWSDDFTFHSIFYISFRFRRGRDKPQQDYKVCRRLFQPSFTGIPQYSGILALYAFPVLGAHYLQAFPILNFYNVL